MNVLLAVDESCNCKAAAQILSQIQLPVDSDLYLLHVNPLDEWLRLGTAGHSLHIVEQINTSRATAADRMRDVLSQMENTFVKPGLAVHSLVTDGVPGAEILRVLAEYHIDLVLLGTRRPSKITSFLLGSVSEWVLNEAPCSVLIVRGKTRARKITKGLNILFATDGSPDAKEAIEFVERLGLPPSTVLTLLHVVRKKIHQTTQLLTTDRVRPDTFIKLAEDLLEARGREGATLLETTRKVLNRPEIKIVENLAFGHEADEILKAAKRTRADLVVMGSRGLTGLRRFLLGSVSNKVTRHAPCSVVVVRNRHDPNPGELELDKEKPREA
jgi:nucleotide-binding universal stress UspA family protein